MASILGADDAYPGGALARPLRDPQPWTAMTPHQSLQPVAVEVQGGGDRVEARAACRAGGLRAPSRQRRRCRRRRTAAGRSRRGRVARRRAVALVEVAVDDDGRGRSVQPLDRRSGPGEPRTRRPALRARRGRAAAGRPSRQGRQARVAPGAGAAGGGTPPSPASASIAVSPGTIARAGGRPETRPRPAARGQGRPPRRAGRRSRRRYGPTAPPASALPRCRRPA